jgi:hypothetical protein
VRGELVGVRISFHRATMVADWIQIAVFLIFALGVAIQGVAVVAMCCYALRRRLPLVTVVLGWGEVLIIVAVCMLVVQMLAWGMWRTEIACRDSRRCQQTVCAPTSHKAIYGDGVGNRTVMRGVNALRTPRAAL